MSAGRRTIALDLRPLRIRRFRLLWLGASVAALGSKLIVVVVAKQVYDLTGSSLAVGAVAAAELVPLMGVALVGGAVADAFDRRRVLVVCGLGEMVATALLVANSMLGRPRVWPVYVLAALLAGLSSVSTPTRWAVTPRLVPPELFPAASALESLSWNLAEIAGPAVAGLLLGLAGLSGTYLVQVGAGLFALATLAGLGALPPVGDSGGVNLRSIVDGLRYLKGRQALQGTYLIDFNAMIFGMPSALFPALAAERFGNSDAALGLLYAAPGFGALLGTLSSGWTGRIHRHGLAITLAVVGWGLAITAVGVPGPLWVALAMLAAAGWADLISVIFRKTMWATMIPDEYRGRLGGIAWANVRGGLLLGNVEAGTVAQLTSTTFSVLSGGLACVAGAGVLSLLLPRFVRYDRRRFVAERDAAGEPVADAAPDALAPG